MNLGKTLFILTFFVLNVSLSYGQKITESENWLKGFQTEADYLPDLHYRSDKVTREDIDRGKKRLEIIRQFNSQSEWEGIYYSNTGIGDSIFFWNEKGGYFSFYFYHELKSFRHGIVKNKAELVELIPDKSENLQKNLKKSIPEKLVKVKIGERHFLVPEKKLQDFCELAAGLKEYWDEYYWFKHKDMQKKSSALPTLPVQYKKFLRHPIRVKITGIGKRKIIPNKQSTKENNFDDIHYAVTINAGKKKGLKKDMNFFVAELGEWIRIKKVLQTSSIGIISRDFDENNKEQCRDDESGEITPCKDIRIGMSAKTVGSL